jgi:hypothetical protein
MYRDEHGVDTKEVVIQTLKEVMGGASERGRHDFITKVARPTTLVERERFRLSFDTIGTLFL